MREDVDGDPADGVERRKQIQGVLRREPKYRPPLRDDDERLLVREVGVDVANRGGGELQGELAVASRQIVA